MREKPFPRGPRSLVAAAVAASSLVGPVALAAPASAGPQILNPINPFDIQATEMWLPYGNRSRLWFRADNVGGDPGRVTGIRCTIYSIVDRGRPDGGWLWTDTRTIRVSADLPVGAWVGWEFNNPWGRLIERDRVECTFTGVRADGRAEVDPTNNTKVVWGYGQY